MKPCHSCMHCWHKSDLVCKAVAAICYLWPQMTVVQYLYIFRAIHWMYSLVIYSILDKTANYTFLYVALCKGLNQIATADSKCSCRSPNKTVQHIPLRSLDWLFGCQSWFENTTLLYCTGWFRAHIWSADVNLLELSGCLRQVCSLCRVKTLTKPLKRFLPFVETLTTAIWTAVKVGTHPLCTQG